MFIKIVDHKSEAEPAAIYKPVDKNFGFKTETMYLNYKEAEERYKSHFGHARSGCYFCAGDAAPGDYIGKGKLRRNRWVEIIADTKNSYTYILTNDRAFLLDDGGHTVEKLS